LPKNCRIILLSAPNASSEVTWPSEVGLRTAHTSVMWSSRRCMWKVSSMMLIHGPIVLTLWIGPPWIWMQPALPMNTMIGRSVPAAPSSSAWVALSSSGQAKSLSMVVIAWCRDRLSRRSIGKN
jgi:hypothetical protein